MPIKNRFAEILPEATEWRRDFHRNPELLYDVHRTAGRVAELLREFGVDEVVEGVGRTGVVGVIRGRKAESGRTIALRADMDALPIHEATGLDYASQTEGKMHACGHDGHTATLLAAAKYLAETRNFDGSVVLAFQPAEEGGAGGREMIEDGLAERWNVDEFYGMHNWPGLPVGQFAIREGGIMASADEFTVTVTGKGGHAAMPHNSVDPTVACAHMIVALQSIVSRNIDPVESAVVSVTVVKTDNDAHNVIPNVAHMSGTVRALTPENRDLLEKRFREVVQGVASAMGVEVAIDYHRGYPVTVNHPEETKYAIEAARAVGEAVNPEMVPSMGGEDFSFMLEARPGAYIFLGNGDTAGLHHPKYNFSDEAIPYGASWFAELVERRLPAG